MLSNCMKSVKSSILILLLLTSSGLFAQNLRGHFVTTEKLDKGKTYCDDLKFKSVEKAETFIFCKSVYSHKYDFREALKVIEIAQKKHPYSYDIRLEKALALHDLGSSTDAAKELIGLIKLYPDKFELHNYMARIQYNNDRVKSVMPFIVSVMTDPNNPQATENITFIKRLLSSKSMSWELESKNNQTLSYTGADNFDMVKYQLTRDSRNDEANTRAFLINRIDTLCKAIEQTDHNKSGFFWDYYAKYFLALKHENLIPTAVDYMLHPGNSMQFQRLKSINSIFGIK